MNKLRGVLYLTALIWGLAGVLLAVFPRFAVVTVLRQLPFGEYVWVRVAGIEAVALALLAVLVAHYLDRAWWWSWAFVLVAAAEAVLFTLNAWIGTSPGAAVWPWWVLAAGQWALAVALLWGLARAGAQRAPA
jgi:hypothetical protein